MILEIEYYKRDILLVGKDISELKLQKQIEYVQSNYDCRNDNFIELLCRCFGWEIFTSKCVPDYTYDRDIEKLIRNLR